MGFNQFKVATKDLEALERDVKSIKIPEYFEIRTTKDVGPRVSTLHVEVSPPIRFIDMRMSMQEQEEIRLREKAKAEEIDKEVIEKATEHRVRMQDWDKREWVQLGSVKIEPKSKPDITLPSLRAHVTKTPDGLYHVQNIVMGHLGQHHIHTKESFEKWRQDVKDVKIEEGECGCDLKVGWVREYDGKTWYNPKFAPKSSMDQRIEEGKRESERKYGHLTLKKAALATKSEEDFINDVVRYNRRRINELNRWGPKDERGYPKQGWIETASQYWKHVREPKKVAAPKKESAPTKMPTPKPPRAPKARKLPRVQIPAKDTDRYQIVLVDKHGRARGLSVPMSQQAARASLGRLSGTEFSGSRIRPHRKSLAARLLGGY